MPYKITPKNIAYLPVGCDGGKDGGGVGRPVHVPHGIAQVEGHDRVGRRVVPELGTQRGERAVERLDGRVRMVGDEKCGGVLDHQEQCSAWGDRDTCRMYAVHDL
jgi:hypothetical protein